MRTVEIITLAATIVGILASLIVLRRRDRAASPFARWRARAALPTDPRPE